MTINEKCMVAMTGMMVVIVSTYAVYCYRSDKRMERQGIDNRHAIMRKMEELHAE